MLLTQFRCNTEGLTRDDTWKRKLKEGCENLAITFAIDKPNCAAHVVLHLWSEQAAGYSRHDAARREHDVEDERDASAALVPQFALELQRDGRFQLLLRLCVAEDQLVGELLRQRHLGEQKHKW